MKKFVRFIILVALSINIGAIVGAAAQATHDLFGTGMQVHTWAVWIGGICMYFVMSWGFDQIGSRFGIDFLKK